MLCYSDAYEHSVIVGNKPSYCLSADIDGILTRQGLYTPIFYFGMTNVGYYCKQAWVLDSSNNSIPSSIIQHRGIPVVLYPAIVSNSE